MVFFKLIVFYYFEEIRLEFGNTNEVVVNHCYQIYNCQHDSTIVPTNNFS